MCGFLLLGMLLPFFDLLGMSSYPLTNVEENAPGFIIS